MSELEQKKLDSKSIRDQELNDLKSILATDYGKRFLMRLINRSNYLQPTYGGGAQISDFAFMEGRREFGLYIIGEITLANSDAWLDMQKNHFKETKEKVNHERSNNDYDSN
ncbi:Bbp19 family protein [Acinetobacter baumannii]